MSELKGLYLVEPHGHLIHDGKKSAIAQSRYEPGTRFDLRGHYYIVSKEHSQGLTFGEATVGEPKELSIAAFDSLFDAHRVTTKERRRWWPDAETLWLYPILTYTPYAQPKPTDVPPGTQTIMEDVKFITTGTQTGVVPFAEPVPSVPVEVVTQKQQHEEDTMPYSRLSEINPALRGIEPPITLAQANLIAKWADAMEEAEDGPESPWAAAIAQFKRLYRVEGNRWVKRDETDSSKVRGEGQGVGGPRQGIGGPRFCICPECGFEVEHTRNVPCTEIECPKCGTMLEGKDDEGEPETEKARWERAYINDLPDSAFLYVEPGGEKDETGRTVPRTLRHLPYKNADGEIDLPHLRSALSRLGQPKTGEVAGEDWLTEDLRKRLYTKAQDILAKQTKAVTKTDNGVKFTAAAYLYVPDPDKPSTWKLRIQETPGKVTVRQLGRAAAALSPKGYRGRRVSLPADDRRVCAKKLISKYRGLNVSDVDIPDYLWGIAGMAKPKAEKATSILESLRDGFDTIASGLRSLVNSQAECDDQISLPTTFEGNTGLFTTKALDGRTWLLTWTTNAFRDRDGEIFTTKALNDYVNRHFDDETKGTFRFWHIPGTDFGDIRYQGVAGRFLIEAGPFHDTKAGRQAEKFFSRYADGHPSIAPEGWGTSQGFLYDPKDREDGVYDWFEKKETSILPASVAANPYNPQPEVIPMDDKQYAALKEIWGEDFAKRVVSLSEQRTKEMEDEGIAFKKTGGEPDSDEKKLALAIAGELQLDALSEAFKALGDTVATLVAETEALKQQVSTLARDDHERLAEKELTLPRFSWFRASQAAETVLQEGDKPHGSKAAIPSAIASIAEQI